MDDIIRGIDLLQERHLLYDGHSVGFGKGFAAVDLLHAAALDNKFRIGNRRRLNSYASIKRTPIHRRSSWRGRSL